MAAARALTVAEALVRVLEGAVSLPAETVAIEDAQDRILAAPVAATLTQPPFDASAMDGYAVRGADVVAAPVSLRVVGEAAAGHPFSGAIGEGEAVRIFTGAPLPRGADAIVIQEDTRREGDVVVVEDGTIEPGYVRPRGGDFAAGDVLLGAGRKVGPRELSLAAAMGHGALSVHRRPRVAILSTGDELVPPGATPGAGQIVSSNHLGVGALARLAGAEVVQLGIARDRREDLAERFERARDADILVTIGGASVGDHDLVGPVLSAMGMELAFWKIAMRPGKPLMSGRLGSLRVMGLPGNPVSSMVCARVFLVPLIHALSGRPPQDEVLETAIAAVEIEANGPRQHYMRAKRTHGPSGELLVTPAPSQDSSLLSPLAAADCLVVRPAGAPAAAPGTAVPVLPLDF